MDTVIVFVAQYMIVLSVVLAGYVFIRLPRAQQSSLLLTAVAAGALSYFLAFVLGQFVYDPRPFVVGHFTPLFSHGNDNGMPSDHTLLASFLAFVIYRYNKKWSAVLFGMALLIGLSRVAAGVHHLIDIVASIVITAFAVWLVDLVIKKRLK